MFIRGPLCKVQIILIVMLNVNGRFYELSVFDARQEFIRRSINTRTHRR